MKIINDQTGALLIAMTECSSFFVFNFKVKDKKFIQRVGTLIFIIFFGVSVISAQESYIKGRIILMNHDTLRGFYFQPSLDERRINVVFKKTLKGKTKSINKKQIKSLHSEYVNYESHPYSNQKLITLHPLSPTQKDTLILYPDTFFLEVIVQGGLTLYRRHEVREAERFFILEGDSLKELIGNKLTLQGYKSNDQYKLQLHEYLVRCKEKSYDSRKIDFREKDLAALVLHENECRKDVQFIKKLGTVWRWQAITGYTTSLMRYYNLAKNKWRDFNWKSSNLPVLGISVTPFQYNKPNRYLLVTEAFFQHQNAQTEVRYIENFNDANGLIKLESFNLKINLLGQAYIRNQGLKMYVLGGISNSFPLSIPTNDIKVEAVDVSGSPTFKSKAAIGPEDILSYDACFVMGGGIEYQKFSLEFRRDYSDGLSKNLSLVNNNRNTYILLKYKL